MFAPSVARNADALLNTIGPFVPQGGQALEIASGTGEHIVRYAAQFPDTNWQPSDIAPDRLSSIRRWIDHCGLSNVSAPLVLDSAEANWSDHNSGYDLILLANLLHLISKREAETVIAESFRALNPGGNMFIYGPFLRAESFASEADERFHASLVASDPEIGYKSLEYVQAIQSELGFHPIEPLKMPANNLVLVARKI